ncbi:Polysaccharide deacetylase [Natronoarchaeum philippinense]|uniref:Polysaccharide deacetylase n=1 Tax=Natronoarchaeum philippinense TaxID=558529 RepID=A0A285P678_NATPI|nr:polysaccharide deacetylase family protein [Natronoarchaeum philippinense]SNZ15381.1 Polysaccharide deacetylase [Natronoarchaeum philippinense]
MGTFVVSLDTEFSWGCFDTGDVDRYKQAYRNTRSAITSLCDLFDQYEVPATWALVMHLLEDCSGHEEMISPEIDRVDDWFDASPCSSGIEKELWYAPDVLTELRSREVDHEIGLHGYSHMILGEPGCTREAAEAEIQKAVAVAEEAGISPQTFIFPRNKIGHIDILAEHGIQSYRGKDDRWYEYRIPGPLRRPLRFGDEFFCRTPPVVTPQKKSGLVEVPGSQIFRPVNDKWQYTPARTQVKRAKKGLDRAAKTGKIFHLWFHPFNVATELERHLQLFEEVLKYAAQLRSEGKIQVQTMADLAERA